MIIRRPKAFTARAPQDRFLISKLIWFPEKNGAAEGTRTPDPIITNDVLYQLSYSGILLLSKPAGGADNDAALTIVVWVAKDLFFHFLVKQTIGPFVGVV